jgi:uncharacterized protein
LVRGVLSIYRWNFRKRDLRQSERKVEMIRSQQGKVVALGALIVLAIAWQPVEGEQKGVVTVIGEGQVSVRPDVARISIGVGIEAPTVRSALQMNREIMAKVLATLEELGIAERDIATSNFSIHFQANPRSGRQPDGEKGDDGGGYRVNNMARVTVRDLEKIDDVLERTTEAGANQVWGVQMVVDDPREAERQARKLAAEQAKEKGLELAELHGRKLGKVIGISEVMDGSPRMAGMREMSGGGSIRPGELEVGVRLQVIFRLD